VLQQVPWDESNAVLLALPHAPCAARVNARKSSGHDGDRDRYTVWLLRVGPLRSFISGAVRGIALIISASVSLKTAPGLYAFISNAFLNQSGPEPNFRHHPPDALSLTSPTRCTAYGVCLEAWTIPPRVHPSADVGEKSRMVKVNPIVMLIVASAVCWVIAAWLVVWLLA
jgi:hypothetical protein